MREVIDNNGIGERGLYFFATPQPKSELPHFTMPTVFDAHPIPTHAASKMCEETGIYLVRDLWCNKTPSYQLVFPSKRHF